MNIILCDTHLEMVQKWFTAVNLATLEHAEIIHGNILTCACAAYVSPANSFGFMDGGVDLAYSHHFGWNVQHALQGEIKKRPFQELPVGDAIAVATGDTTTPWLISTPTMRVPSCIPHENVYLAARAAMNMALQLKVDSIAFPGMGTGCGMVPKDVAAFCMVKGISDAISPPPFPVSLRELYRRGIRT